MSAKDKAVPADNLADVPTMDEYKEALLACRPALRSKAGFSGPIEMLRANYYAPKRTVVATELARDANLANLNAANLAYGKLAKALCAELKRTPKFPVAILVTFSGDAANDEPVSWTMIPQLAAALEDLGWVKPDDASDD